MEDASSGKGVRSSAQRISYPVDLVCVSADFSTMLITNDIGHVVNYLIIQCVVEVRTAARPSRPQECFQEAANETVALVSVALRGLLFIKKAICQYPP